ncbi:hypothetical protein AX16_008447 [Volvariella volvacea WC 439]|nr:hypothetical protein AX16_008447 [Volvariella volvacea WC 439]
MLLATLFIFLLTHTLAHPIPPPSRDPITPTSPVLNAFVAVSDCIRDPTRVRSTWELIWNCVGTIFVCTYVAIHPNIPNKDATKWEKMWQRIKTCVYALLAPEAIIMLAMRQRFAAAKIAKRNQDHDWTVTHGFFVIMGGLMREGKNGFRVVTMDSDGNIRSGGKKEKGIILPAISEEEIQDKAKGDFLSKVVVVLQTSWFMIQCTARYAQGLVITELELATLAFATLNIITYFLWWSKPLNAEYPIYFNKDGSRSSGPVKTAKISTNRGLSDGNSSTWLGLGFFTRVIPQRIKEDMGEKLSVSVVWKWLIIKAFSLIVFPFLEMMGTDGSTKLHRTWVDPYYGGELPDTEWIPLVSLSSLVGILFGGIHLLGWNFEFSTEVERDLWRMASIIVTVQPAVIAASTILAWLDDRHPGLQILIWAFGEPIATLAGFIGPILYVPARLSLFFLPVYALRDPHPSTHQNIQWSDFIPHI